MLDFRFFDSAKRAVTLQTARKRLDSAPEVERLDDLEKLIVCVRRAHRVSMRHDISFEKPKVPREHDPALIAGTAGDARIVEIALIDAIETQEPQVARELSQVHVGNEFWLAERLRPKPRHARHVQPFEHRIDGNALSSAQAVLEPDGLPVHEDDIDLGMRNPERFDKVFDRTRFTQAVTEASLPPIAGEKIIELLVESKLDLFVSHLRKYPRRPTVPRRTLARPPGASIHASYP